MFRKRLMGVFFTLATLLIASHLSGQVTLLISQQSDNQPLYLTAGESPRPETAPAVRAEEAIDFAAMYRSGELGNMSE